jgi:hypothetical protein
MAFNFHFRNLLGQLLLITLGASADLPTLYEYYTEGGINSGLSVDQPYFTLNGKNISIYSGAIHYFRVPPELWQDRLRKLRATGVNTVETYIAWNIHEPQDGVFDFGDGGTELEAWADLPGFLRLAQQEDLFVVIRPGPYICGEWEFGGLPSWLLRNEGIQVRTRDPTFMSYVERYFGQLMPILTELQFTKGGPIIMVQVENEFGYSANIDLEYLQQLYDLYKSSGIVELLVSNDGTNAGQSGTLPGQLFQTGDFGSDIQACFETLEEMQPNKPVMDMEFYTGWLDHWTEEQHHTRDPNDFRDTYEQILAYPGSVNFYMFHGGTNWGFMNGANNGSGDNSNFQPVTTSYDYDAPLTEAGDYTTKYEAIRELMKQYNTIETYTPDPPEVKERRVYDSLDLNGQLRFEDILRQAPDKIESDVALSMEMLPINQNSGQSYGYIVYHREGLDIPANSLLTITGHVRDTVMVLVNNVLLSNALTSRDRLDTFGYWRIENGNITLTTEALNGATLDLIIENWGRVGFGNFYYQYKGLTDSNRVFLNDEELSSWTIYPLEFKKSWNQNLADWGSVEESQSGPALYKTTLTIDDDDITDTFIDMRGWVRGFVIVNGIVLGRYASGLGPQQALYLPGPWLQKGDNEIIVFEHSLWPGSQIVFSKDPIYSS